VIRKAIQIAIQLNIVIVTGVGNDGRLGTNYLSHYEGVISVGATNYYKERANYSNYGPYVDLMAPVGDLIETDQSKLIFSTSLNNMYNSIWGTSFSSPQVAGVIALMKSLRPNLSVKEITNLLFNTSIDLGLPGHDWDYGFGLINATRAMIETERIIS
jgi:subtilisin family serine protease